jgi:hypothetical protein
VAKLKYLATTPTHQNRVHEEMKNIELEERLLLSDARRFF